jgi:catechol 2,3-dioxygenase-like lactoylglutathione lyase family enzyme
MKPSKTLTEKFVFALATSLMILASIGSRVATAQSEAKPTIADSGEFQTPTIHIGCVVSDIDKAVAFYTKAIGFKVERSFSVDAAFASEVGLTNQKKLNVQVLALGQGKGATQLKLMQVAGESKKPNNDFIHSTLGFSYLTIFAKDLNAALTRLDSVGGQPVAAPKPLPKTEMMLVLVRDPDGNLIELIGPEKDPQ